MVTIPPINLITYMLFNPTTRQNSMYLYSIIYCIYYDLYSFLSLLLKTRDRHCCFSCLAYRNCDIVDRNYCDLNAPVIKTILR